MSAAERFLRRENYDRAATELARIDPATLNPEQLLRYTMMRSQLALALGQTAEALTLLQTIPEAAEPGFSGGVDYHILLAQTRLAGGDNEGAAADMLRAVTLFPNRVSRLQDTLWRILLLCNGTELNRLGAAVDNYEAQGWVELAKVSHAHQFNLPGQLEALSDWRRVWERHPAASRPPELFRNMERAWNRRPRHIALILPLQEAAGNAIHEGFISAYYEALTGSGETPRISVFDSSGETSVLPVYSRAVASGADLIIGPLNKNLVNQLGQLRRRRLQVPTLALNYTTIDGRSGGSNLYQFGLAPQDEIAQAVDLAWSAGHRNAAMLTPADPDYIRLQDEFVARWTERGGNLMIQAAFSGAGDYTDEVKRLLAVDSSESRRDRLMDLLPRQRSVFVPRRRNDIDFVFLIANPRQGRQIKPTLGFYFAEDLPVYSIPSIYDGRSNPNANKDLNDIIFTDAPWVLGEGGPLKDSVLSSLRPAQGGLQRLRAMGVDGFRLHTRLTQLAAGEVEVLHGMTGILSMDENNRIHRKLETARFEGGLAMPLEP